jgi:hypothetical protein
MVDVELSDSLVNAIMRGEPMPPQWRVSVVVLLHKDKGSKHKFRPIALTQVGYKIFATSVEGLLNVTTEKAGFLSDAQNGFRKSRGTAQKLLGVYAV